MSKELPYENIVSALLLFIWKSDIMTHGKNTVHSIHDMVDIMAAASVRKSSVGGHAAALRAQSDDDSNAPGDEWVRKAYARADVEMVGAAFNGIISGQFEILRKVVGLIPITIAIDKHLIPRYDKRYGAELVRSKRKKGTGKFEAYITAQCVIPGMRITLAVFPIGQGHSTAEFVRKIVDKCISDGIKIRGILMDREFFSVSVLDVMDKTKQKYLTPCRNTYNVVAALNEFDAKMRDRTSECFLENQEASVKYVMMIAKRTACRKKDSDAKPSERFIGFAANSNELDVAAYKRRWGIETGYRMIEDVRMKTRGKNPGARFLCFAASVILYNQWVVINAQWGFVKKGGKWHGISFTMLEFKVVLESKSWISPEPPPGLAP